eukprot:3872217-Pleurochrysis_carterae.AAC.2
MKQVGSASMPLRRGLLGAKLKLSDITSCIILLEEVTRDPRMQKQVGWRGQGPRRKAGAALDEAKPNVREGRKTSRRCYRIRSCCSHARRVFST